MPAKTIEDTHIEQARHHLKGKNVSPTNFNISASSKAGRCTVTVTFIGKGVDKSKYCTDLRALATTKGFTVEVK